MKDIFPITERNIEELLDPDLGATVIKPTKLPIIPMLHAVTPLLAAFTKAESKTLVSNYSFKCLPIDEASVWTTVSKCLARALNEQLDLDEEIVFDDLYLTSYSNKTDPSAIGVGPHRDTNCKGIVATIILAGELPFCICRDRDMSGSVSIPVRTGEILLMRAEGFGNLPKPMHYVGAVGNGAIIQFGLRQYINPKH